MVGKRPGPASAMRRTSSVSLIGSGSMDGDESPLPEHPREKQKSSNYPSPSSATASVPRQVIGFHPKVVIEEELGSPHSHQHSPHSQARSPSGSAGSPRSGLVDLFAGSRPWDRREEGVGLSIVAALSGSQEEMNKGRDEPRGYPVPPGGYGGKISPPQPHHLPSLFAPSRASPPIPIHAPTDSGYHCASAHCSHQSCGLTYGIPSGRAESMVIDSGSGSSYGSNLHRAGVSRPDSNVTWSKPSGNHCNGVNVMQGWRQHADMDIDRAESNSLATSPFVSRHGLFVAPSFGGFGQNFLDACHLCRRRLGDGRDIYIYRGDKAFCSPECRHQQIVNDERPERCSSAVMKSGAVEARSSSQRNRVMAAGTAAAA